MDDTTTTPAELQLEPVVRISPETPLVEVARIFAAANLDLVIVDTTPVTEITEHDITRAVARGLAFETPVREVVHDAALFVTRDVTIERIAEVMLQRRRHAVVVVDEFGDVCGLLTLPVAIAVLLEGPPWLGAFRIALGIEGSAP
jgi:CBS domain-containing protein